MSMFEPEQNLNIFVILKTSTLFENIAEITENDWQMYITISLGLVYTKNNSTQRLKNFNISTDCGRPHEQTDGRQTDRRRTEIT